MRQGQTIWTSLSRGLFGFSDGHRELGAPIGLLIARFSWIRNSFGSLITGLQSMPSVAWVPLAILWFQISPAMIYMVVLLGAVPSIANGLVAGIDQVPPLYSRVGHVLGLGWRGQARHVLLPAALSNTMSRADVNRSYKCCAAERGCAEKSSASYNVVEAKTIRALFGHNGFSGCAVSRMNRMCIVLVTCLRKTPVWSV